MLRRFYVLVKRFGFIDGFEFVIDTLYLPTKMLIIVLKNNLVVSHRFQVSLMLRNKTLGYPGSTTPMIQILLA